MTETRVPTPEEAARQRLSNRAMTLATVLSLVDVPSGPACAVVFAWPHEKFCFLRGRIVDPQTLLDLPNWAKPDPETMGLYHWFVDEDLGPRSAMAFLRTDCTLDGDGGPGWLLHIRDRAIAEQAIGAMVGG